MSPPARHLPLLLAFALVALKSSLAAPAGVITSWSCVPLSSVPLAGGAAQWDQYNCSSTGVPLFGPSGPSVVNVVTASLAASLGVRLVPVVAQSDPPGSVPLQPLNAMAASDGRSLVAGINGGYFFRLDVSNFFDNVCLGKNASDAEAPVSLASPNDGTSDGSIVSGGALLGCNCDCIGFSRPAILSINGSSSSVDLLTRGAPPPSGLALDSISAGPFLLATNETGTFVSIPHDDDNIANIFEHSANTAVALSAGGSSAYFVTFDGHDGCGLFDPTCGTNAFTLAYFLKDFLNATQAMGMDQGGSTTMWVSGQANATDGIVSNPGQGVRPVYSGLFLLAD